MFKPNRLICHDKVPYPDDPNSNFPIVMAIVTMIAAGAGTCVKEFIGTRFDENNGSQGLAKVVKKAAEDAAFHIEEVFQGDLDVLDQTAGDIHVVINGSAPSGDE